MRLPRDISATQPVTRLGILGYGVLHQKGSHIRLHTEQNGPHRVSVPKHNPLKVGMLHEILGDVAGHFGVDVEERLNILKMH